MIITQHDDYMSGEVWEKYLVQVALGGPGPLYRGPSTFAGSSMILTYFNILSHVEKYAGSFRCGGIP